MTTTATLDRQTMDYALLVADDGRLWDVYGDSARELRTEARILAEYLGIEIVCFNMELPE